MIRTIIFSIYYILHLYCIIEVVYYNWYTFATLRLAQFHPKMCLIGNAGYLSKNSTGISGWGSHGWTRFYTISLVVGFSKIGSIVLRRVAFIPVEKALIGFGEITFILSK